MFDNARYIYVAVFAGDAFSTPPNSPPPRNTSTTSAGHPDHHQRERQPSLNSYEKAVNLNAVCSEETKTNHAMPHHISSPVRQQLPTPLPSNLLPDYPNVAIVNSSPAAVRVGFFEPKVEATNPGELPGSTQGGGGEGGGRR